MNKNTLVDRFKPRKFITKIDVETMALAGKDSIQLAESFSITDEAREKAQQLGIKVIPFTYSERKKVDLKTANKLEDINSSNLNKINLEKIVTAVVSLLKEKSIPISENIVNQIVRQVVKKL